jgi:hypothetical protein
MSKKGQQGPGAHVPAPPPDPARVDPLAPPLHGDSVASVAPAKLGGDVGSSVDTGAVTPPFVEPFEPKPDVQPVTDLDRQIMLETELSKVTLEREMLEAEREQLKHEREALAEARDRFEKERKAPRAHRPDVAPRDVPDDIVDVEALTGVTDTLRVVQRGAGERFRLRRDQAEAAEDQGLVKIL